MRTVLKYRIKKITTADEISEMMSKIPDMVERLKERRNPQNHYEKLASFADNFILLSENEEVCGYVAVYANDFKTQIAYITFIGCVPQKRHMGYGQKLFDYACERAKDRGMSTLKLEVAYDNENAIGFYKKNGMREVGQTTHGFIMEKQL